MFCLLATVVFGHDDFHFWRRYSCRGGSPIVPDGLQGRNPLCFPIISLLSRVTEDSVCRHSLEIFAVQKVVVVVVVIVSSFFCSSARRLRAFAAVQHCGEY